MKRKLFTAAMLIIMVLSMVVFTACNNDGSNENNNLRFAVPEGTPALAVAKLVTDNKKIDNYFVNYDVVSASNIAAEMSSNKSDLVIMPVNAGAKLIKQGAKYKLISVAVGGSLYLVGKSNESTEITSSDLAGKTVACIGKMGTPGLIFRFLIGKYGYEIIEDGTPTQSQIKVNYVPDGTAAKSKLLDGLCDYAVVGEPAATVFKQKIGCNAQMNLQTEYANQAEGNVSTYPQAGLFVKEELANNSNLIESLFVALANNKTWINENKNSVSEFMKENLYESAVFPSECIDKCAIDVTPLNETKKKEIITFLKVVDKSTDWDNANIF